MEKKILEKKIVKVLKRSKKPLDQIEIAKKINENPFVVSEVLHNFQKKGMVAVQ